MVDLARKDATLIATGEIPAGVYNPATTAWTIGTTTANPQHNVIGTLLIDAPTASAAKLLIRHRTGSVLNDRWLEFQGSGGTPNGYVAYNGDPGIAIGASSTGSISFEANAVRVGSVSSIGSWTFGTQSGATIHQFWSNNIGNDIVAIANFSTSTSSDVRSCIQLQKGSPTTTNQQRFIRFLVGNGANDSGIIAANGVSNAAFFANSDFRLKEDIITLDSAMDKINQLRIVDFKWKNSNERRIGFIAQEMYQVFPQFVYKSDDGISELPKGADAWSVSDSGLMPYVIRAIQEIKAEFDAYKAANPVRN